MSHAITWSHADKSVFTYPLWCVSQRLSRSCRGPDPVLGAANKFLGAGIAGMRNLGLDLLALLNGCAGGNSS